MQPAHAKKAALAAYKERKKRLGIFALRLPAPGGEAVFVSASGDLDQAGKGLAFALKMGSHPNPALVAAFRAAGNDAEPVIEVLEEMEPEEDPVLRAAALKARAAYWRDKLSAKAV